jgi:RimJ/RimL family protein N-acetyltransferase
MTGRMLRPAHTEDLDPLLALVREPSVADSIAFFAAEELTRAIEQPDGEGAVLVIEHDGALAGALRWVMVNRRSRIAAIRTLMIAPGRQGRGLGSAAVGELARDLFARGVHRLEAECLAYNVAGVRLFERAGFTREGVRRAAYDRRGSWQDAILFGRVAEDQVRAAGRAAQAGPARSTS